MRYDRHNIYANQLHEKILYIAADGRRKDTITIVFFVGWIFSGLAIIFLELNYGRGAVLMALLAVAVAGSIFWIMNNWWKYKLQARYSPDDHSQSQLYSEEPR